MHLDRPVANTAPVSETVFFSAPKIHSDRPDSMSDSPGPVDVTSGKEVGAGTVLQIAAAVPEPDF